jgi:hypothetical protein
MKKDEIISMLQQQNAFLQRQLKDALQQLGESNRKVDELLRKVSSLEELLVQKNQEEQKQQNIIKGLTKIQQNKSEKQYPPVVAPNEPAPDSNDGQTPPGLKRREKTNYGARRKEHYEVEVEEEDIYPTDSRFDEMKARLIDTRDVVRYILVPMRFIKKVYHVHVYTQDGTVMEGKAPLAPLQGSNYDGSFIAGIAQLRYIYSMPVERIVKYFSENGFDMDKGTAHGLLRKTEAIFEGLYKAMGVAVKEDDYLAGDETYHRVLVRMPDGKGSKKGYIWVVTAIHTGLVYYFYHDGSRGQDVILNYIGDYGGTFQSDGFAPYRKMAAQLTRLSCLQHVKRKFLDCGDDDEEAQSIVRLINELYQMEHQHKIWTDGWTVEKNLRWRRKYAPRILSKIRKKLDQMDANPQMLPKSDRYNAVHYMLNEWEAIENIFNRGDYNLDNNLVERLNRYISLSRRNSLFFGSHKGAERAAMYYSLACSCRLNNINFFEYISDVINRAATIPPKKPIDIQKYRELLPDRWKAL